MPLPSRPLRLSVVIVSYNTRDLTSECLRVLREELCDIPAEVLVIDNASTDGSPEAIRRTFPQVRLIANPHNAGFGAANNLAFAQARGHYLLLLNTDAFLQPGALRALIEY
ncbi:MAG: glycosyltransferase, partial [Rhodospirillales bacterium]|nr:glycosyltransferase [Acetobacter sp.]